MVKISHEKESDNPWLNKKIGSVLYLKIDVIILFRDCMVIHQHPSPGTGILPSTRARAATGSRLKDTLRVCSRTTIKSE